MTDDLEKRLIKAANIYNKRSLSYISCNKYITPSDYLNILNFGRDVWVKILIKDIKRIIKEDSCDER